MKRPKNTFIVAGDLHWSGKSPDCRKNYLQVLTDKLAFLAKECRKHGASLILAGDVFDVWTNKPYVESALAKVLKGVAVYAIAGQHDLPQHNMRLFNSSSLSVLVNAGSMILLDNEPVFCDGGVDLYGCSWGRPIPIVVNPDAFNILVIHRMVYTGHPPYPGAPTKGNVTRFVKEVKEYDLVICGDNHKAFESRTKGNPIILNCGSVARMERPQLEEHTPVYYLVTDDRVSGAKPIPLADESTIKEKPNRVNKSEGFKKELSDFVEGIKSGSDKLPNFKKVCRETAKKVGAKKRTKRLLESIIDSDD